jgi:ABC-2 type transport system ATP-binding protein
VLGADPAVRDPAWRARIGIVLQSATDFSELTVSEIVHHFALYYPHPRRPDEVIEAVGLADKRHARTRTLSGGQRRRLDVALGILGRPELLFLDEPTTGFDPEARRQFWQLIEQLAQDRHDDPADHSLPRRGRAPCRPRRRHRPRPAGRGHPSGALGCGQAKRTVVRWRAPEGRPYRPDARPTRLVCSSSPAPSVAEVPDMTVTRPTLEDTYLALIGSSPDEHRHDR